MEMRNIYAFARRKTRGDLNIFGNGNRRIPGPTEEIEEFICNNSRN